MQVLNTVTTDAMEDREYRVELELEQAQEVLVACGEELERLVGCTTKHLSDSKEEEVRRRVGSVVGRVVEVGVRREKGGCYIVQSRLTQ